MRMWFATPSASAPPEEPSPVTTANDRHGQAAHLHQVAGDGLALSALLGVLAGVSARRVDERDDGPTELLGLLHQAQGLAVALRPRHAEVAGQILLQRGALAVTDDGHRHAVEAGHTAQNGGVLPALAVAPLLKEVGEQCGDGLVNVGAVRVPGQKDPVLGGQRAAARRISSSSTASSASSAAWA